MRALLAILGDSLREATDRRALFVLLTLATLLIVAAGGLSFVGGSPQDALREQCNHLGHLRASRGSAQVVSDAPVEAEVGDVRAATAAELAGGYAVDLRLPARADLDRLVRRWQRFAARPLTDPDAGDDAAQPALSPEVVRAAVVERFQRNGWSQVAVTVHALDPPSLTVAVRSEFPHEVAGLHQVGLFYGLVELPMAQLSVAELVVLIQLGLADTFAGFLGMIVAILTTAGFIPNLLQKGTLDLALARPIRRPLLLLGKYLGGLWFVLLIAAFLVTGCWVALTLRAGYSNPAFLLCIATITLQFAVLYSVSTCVGVLTRSSGVASLATLGVWGLSSIVVQARHALREIDLDAVAGEAPDWLQNGLDVAYAVLPKTTDLGTLNAVFLSQSHLSSSASKAIFRSGLPEVDWAYSLGTTAAFAAVMLALAIWQFRRKDW